MQLNTDRLMAKKEGAIGWLTFNNPARLNAMSQEMWQGTANVMADFGADPAIRVVVMKGAGDKAFVSGGDISEFEKTRNSAEAAAIYGQVANKARLAMSGLEKPLIAMIRGYCLGGGLGVALNADLRIASSDSRFGIPAARLSIAYGFEGVKTLVSLVGPAVAKQILFTARRYPAETALRMGLIEEVTAPEDLESVVRSYAETIADNAPLSIRASKLTIAQVLTDESGRDMELLKELSREALNSHDAREGRQAFMEKRKAQFLGR